MLLHDKFRLENFDEVLNNSKYCKLEIRNLLLRVSPHWEPRGVTKGKTIKMLNSELFKK